MLSMKSAPQAAPLSSFFQMPLGGRVIPEAWFDLLPTSLWSWWCGRGAALLLVKLGGLLIRVHEAERRAEEGMEAA